MAVLSIQNLKKRMNGRWILWDINLEISSAEIMAVLGKSDSGKTTLAKIIAGLDMADGGDIRILDEDNHQIKCPIALQKPAYVPQLTIYQNLDMFASLWGIPRRIKSKKIPFLLELLNLSDSRSLRPINVSSGALVKLELARALLPESQFVIIDSLLDNLDHNVYEKVWDYILETRRNNGRSYIIFTSNGKVSEMCNRLAVIHKGRFGFIGRPDDLRRLAGEDMVVLTDLHNPLLRNKLQEQFSMVVKEEDGYLSVRVSNGEKALTDLVTEFGSELGCVYLKRPTLEDALDIISNENTSVLNTKAEKR
ncbi:MAG: ABC transporter ATP-binding protein [Armatimonadota bacterium]